jgi:hypothetical protein
VALGTEETDFAGTGVSTAGLEVAFLVLANAINAAATTPPPTKPETKALEGAGEGAGAVEVATLAKPTSAAEKKMG